MSQATRIQGPAWLGVDLVLEPRVDLARAGIAGPDTQGVLEVTSREYATASAAARRLLSTYVHSLARRPR